MEKKLLACKTREEFIQWFVYYYEKVVSYWIEDWIFFLRQYCWDRGIGITEKTMHDIKTFI